MLLTDRLFDIVRNPTAVRSEFYQYTVDHRNDIAESFGDDYPAFLNINRPKESEEIRKHRADVFRNLVGHFPRRIGQRIASIRQSDDYRIDYATLEQLPKGEETPSEYATLLGLEDIAFGQIGVLSVTDPNAVVCLLPSESDLSLTDNGAFPRPSVQVYPCDYVLSCTDSEVILQNPEGHTITTYRGDGKQEQLNEDGKTYLYISKNAWCFLTETVRYALKNGQIESVYSVTGGYMLSSVNGWMGDDALILPENPLGVVPAIRIGSPMMVEARLSSGERWHKSIIDPALPFVKELHQRYGDIQVEWGTHIFSLLWQMTGRDCPLSKSNTCMGGILTRDYHDNETNRNYERNTSCPVCKGKGVAQPISGHSVLELSPFVSDGKAGSQAVMMPTPPMGYVQKDIAPLTALIQERDWLILQMWDAVEMRFEIETPLVQSGFAKQIDRQPSYRWYGTRAVDLCGGILQPLADWLTQWRYGVWAGKDYKRLANVRVPKTFDTYDAAYITDELKAAQDAGLPVMARVQLQGEYITRRFGRESEVYQRFTIARKHQPMFGETTEQVMSILQPNTAPFILATRFGEVLNEVLDQTAIADLLAMPYKAQSTLLITTANEFVTTNTD